MPTIEITWYGHACVGLATTAGRVVMDPFSPDIGLRPLAVEAELVTLSHHNLVWHSYTKAVAGTEAILDGLTLAAHPLTARGMRFSALRVGEDADRGGEPNAMVACQAGGLRLIHFGDLGHAIEGRETAWLRGAEVWFALAGGKPTIRLDELVAAWERLRPAVLIPIHFRTPSMRSFGTLSNLLSRVPNKSVRRVGASTVELSRESLPAKPEIWVLEPVCDVAAEA